jgi:hypothetical protein
MANPAGESYDGALRLDFDRRLIACHAGIAYQTRHDRRRERPVAKSA